MRLTTKCLHGLRHIYMHVHGNVEVRVESFQRYTRKRRSPARGSPHEQTLLANACVSTSLQAYRLSVSKASKHSSRNTPSQLRKRRENHQGVDHGTRQYNSLVLRRRFPFTSHQGKLHGTNRFRVLEESPLDSEIQVHFLDSEEELTTG